MNINGLRGNRPNGISGEAPNSHQCFTGNEDHQEECCIHRAHTFGSLDTTRNGIRLSDFSSFIATSWKPRVKTKHPAAGATKSLIKGTSLRMR